MISKTLLKLIDTAILPAVAIVTGKLLGMALISSKLGIPFTLNLKSLPPAASSTLNTYSNIFAYGGIALGVLLIMARSYFFHSSHISPQVTIRLHAINLTSIISTTYELFHQAIIWMSYLWLLTLLFLLQAYWELVSPQMAGAVLGTTVILSFFFIRDVDREVDIFALK